MDSARLARAVRPERALNIALWVAQILLFVLYGTAGLTKTLMSVPDLVAHGINYAPDLPFWLLRFIGISELSGAAGILLPTLMRIQPRLTPIAALGLSVLQIFAICFHAVRGETAMALPLNLLLISLSLFVLWGRGRNAGLFMPAP